MPDMPEWESRTRQIITALVQRLESHGDSCVPGCWNDARDRNAIKDAYDLLEKPGLGNLLKGVDD